MKMETFEIITLTASEGMLLTNGEIYTDVVFLGTNDNPNNWHEVPESSKKEE